MYSQRGGEELSKNHPTWELEAYYLAQAIVNFISQKIILGGGMSNLFPLIRKQVQALLNNYIQLPQIQ